MMPVGQSVSAGQAALPLDREIAKQAAAWFIRMSSGGLKPAEHAALEDWRAADPEHERAWQVAMQVSHRAGKLPAHIGVPVLRRPASVNRRQAITMLVALMTAAPVGWFAYRHIPREGHYTTATGEQRHIVLPDGTRIQLNTATEITLAYDATQRLVMLRHGEVLIETAPDPLATTQASRPFIVQTVQGRVRAIGTHFNVRQYEHHSHVGVLQGAVEIKPAYGAGQARLLHAGEQAGFTDHTINVVDTLSPTDTLWARGMLAVDNMRLAEFAHELARYRAGIVRCDPAVADLRVTGAFQLDDTDAIFQNIVTLLPVKVTLLTRYWATIGPRDDG